MKPEIANKILNEVYTHGDRMAICADLEPIPKGGHISLICPQCGERRAYTYQPGAGRTPHIIRCNRSENCGYQATLVQYAAGSKNPRGDEFKKAVQLLAHRAGIQIEGEKVRIEKEYRIPESQQDSKEFIPLDDYFVEKYNALTLGSIGMGYLNSRGISAETAETYGLKSASWGRWPHYILDEATGKKKPYRQWYPGRLVMPVFDTQKRLISLYGRAIQVHGEREPYKYLKHDFLGATKGVFNQVALEQESVHITEGYFDALAIIEAAKMTGCEKNACAIFGVYGLRWELIKSKNICFCFDNDTAGNEWKRLAEEGLKRGKRIFFLSSSTYQGFNDLSEVWEKTGKIKFEYVEFKKILEK